jgi:hypothetical protein
MRIELTERFQRDVRALDAEQRAAIFEAMLSLRAALGDAHRHAGLGLRKLHRSGIWEARVGLGMRMVFVVGTGVDRGSVALLTIGTHDDVRRFLRTLG